MTLNRIGELKARLAEDPQNLIDRFVLMTTYSEAKSWHKAIEEGKEILRQKPDYIAVYVHLGDALLQMGQKEEARELLLHGKELAEKFGHRAPKEGIAKLLSALE